MSKESIFTKKIAIPHEKEIIRVAVIMYVYYWLMYVFDITTKISSLLLTELADIGLEFLITAPFVLLYFKKCEREPQIDFKDKKQYKLIPFLLLVCAVAYVIESIIFYGGVEVKFQMITEGQVGWIVFYFFEYIFVIAVVEEFMCRILIQNDLVLILGKFSIVAPLISAAYFGCIHLVQRNTEIAINAFVVGLIWGYVKYFNKKCTFVTLVVVHGLYDFLVMLL